MCERPPSLTSADACGSASTFRCTSATVDDLLCLDHGRARIGPEPLNGSRRRSSANSRRCAVHGERAEFVSFDTEAECRTWLRRCGLRSPASPGTQAASSPGELEMTCSTSEVAVCCSRASASSRLYFSSCCSRSARDLRVRPTRVLRLRSGRTKLATARSALRPLARQGHLVGTVSGPVPVGRPQPQAWRPSILTEPYRELPPPHSITSSARASSDGGTSRPSALAVLRLMTSSYLVGACTGRSAGFSPFRMRST